MILFSRINLIVDDFLNLINLI